jgi:hypothetical protein
MGLASGPELGKPVCAADNTCKDEVNGGPEQQKYRRGEMI